MPADAANPEVTIWTDAAHAPLVGRVMALLTESATTLAVGGAREAPIDKLAQTLECDRDDDLRRMLNNHPASFILVASSEPISLPDLAAAADEGSIVLAVEPFAHELVDLKPLSSIESSATGTMLTCPRFVRGPGWTSTADPAEAIGTVRMIGSASFGTRPELSLFARLHDAWHGVVSLTEMPEVIHASLAGGPTVAPKTLTALTGCCAAHGQLPDHMSVAVQVADHAGLDRRTLHVFGSEGTVLASDDGYDLFNLKTGPVDSREGARTVTVHELIANDLRRLIDRPSTAPRLDVRELRQTLACCLACLLSIRTGQPERPAKFLDMGP